MSLTTLLLLLPLLLHVRLRVVLLQTNMRTIKDSMARTRNLRRTSHDILPAATPGRSMSYSSKRKNNNSNNSALKRKIVCVL